MNRMPLFLVLSALVVDPASIAAQPLRSERPATQNAPPPVAAPLVHRPRQVISANPLGILVELFNIDYERRATDTVAVGIGGSTAMFDTSDWDSETYQPVTRQERYVNGDVYVRYYPSGKALTGRSFGLKVGLTSIPDQGTYFGYGVDINQSWMLNERFYYGLGLGVKRLVGTNSDSFDLEYIPTLRLNVGIGF